MSGLPYPSRKTVCVPLSGDAAVDEEMVRRAIHIQRSLIEGVCPNGCSKIGLPVHQAGRDMARECPVCGFREQPGDRV